MTAIRRSPGFARRLGSTGEPRTRRVPARSNRATAVLDSEVLRRTRTRPTDRWQRSVRHRPGPTRLRSPLESLQNRRAAPTPRYRESLQDRSPAPTPTGSRRRQLPRRPARRRREEPAEATGPATAASPRKPAAARAKAVTRPKPETKAKAPAKPRAAVKSSRPASAASRLVRWTSSWSPPRCTRSRERGARGSRLRCFSRRWVGSATRHGDRSPVSPRPGLARDRRRQPDAAPVAAGSRRHRDVRHG